jgi:putative Mn2+ efflux pump MntP
MMVSGLREGEARLQPDPSLGSLRIMVCLTTSIDAGAIGLGLAFLQVDILASAIVIGVASSLMGLAGLMLGNHLGQRFGRGVELLGGLLLIGIGGRVLITHLI